MNNKQATPEDIENTNLDPIDAELGEAAKGVGDYKVVGKKNLNPQEFKGMMDNWLHFVDDLFSSPSEVARAADHFVDSSEFSAEELLDKFKTLKPYEFYIDNGIFFMMRPDRKIQKMGDYVTELEKKLIGFMGENVTLKAANSAFQKELLEYQNTSIGALFKKAFKRLFLGGF